MTFYTMRLFTLGGDQSSGLEAFNDPERFLARSAEAQFGLSEIEREPEHRGREVVRLALQGHLNALGTRDVGALGMGDVGDAVMVEVPKGSVRLGHKRPDARVFVSLVGELRLTRTGYSARGHGSVHPSTPSSGWWGASTAKISSAGS